jgi:S-formylglutathione hydrolase FrmB
MRRQTSILLILFALLFTAFPSIAQDSRTSRLRIRVSLQAGLFSKGASGRMLIFMSNAPQKPASLGSGFVPGSNWVAGQEVEWIPSGGSVVIDTDVKAFPTPFSRVKTGTYHFMAVLDVDHSYAYNGPNGGDLVSAVKSVENMEADHIGTVELILSQVRKDRETKDTDNIKLVKFQSPLLSAFWGRPIWIKAGIVLPRSYSSGNSYPTVYSIHGFGGDYRGAFFRGPSLLNEMSSGKRPEMVTVFLDGSFPTGHHEFADSVNNGPWGKALTTEFVPYLEKEFHLVAKPFARFVTGHSSGGWSSLWLQVTYPEFFGGTWSTSPDPVDLRSFTGINVTPGSTDNVYRKKDGTPKNLVRVGGQNVASIEEFVRQEEVVGDYGGQFASFEWVWSPRGQDGRPLQMFNRVTGLQNPEVQRYWQNYDIRRILETNWATLGPRLKGKLHVICGEEDTFHLEEAVKLLKAFFVKVHSEAVCELIPGRDHGNLYQPYKTVPKGLEDRIVKEMYATYQRNKK